MIDLPNFNSNIKDFAIKEGFHLCGISVPSVVEASHIEFLSKWLGAKHNADMDWFERNQDKRIDPTSLVEGAGSIISLAAYYPLTHEDSIASYAHDTDYHFRLKEAANKIIERVNNHYNIEISARVFTDSAPFLERYWAVQAGLGWIGKSGMLINREWGSALLLLQIVCDVRSDIYDTPDPFNGCGNCSLCIDNCPTGAITSDLSVDARRCISYLTIEHRGDFSDEQKKLIARGKSIYGCDICLKSCIWNRKFERVKVKVEVSSDILSMTGGEFKRRYNSLPLIRTGLKNLRRNCQIFMQDSDF